MRNTILSSLVVLAAIAFTVGSHAQQKEAVPVSFGWRGNQTGLYPDATVPVEWSYVSTGPVEGMKCAAEIPADGSDKDAVPVVGGLPTKWLVVGPFPVEDPADALAHEYIVGEATLAPRAGEKPFDKLKAPSGVEGVGELEWTAAEPKSDLVSFWNVNAAGKRGKENQAAYATTCLFARKPGKVRAMFEHVVGMKVYVNGAEVCNDPKYGVVMGSAYGLSRSRLDHNWPVAPPFEFDVKQGWNRLTVKLVSPNRAGWNDLAFFPRIADVPGVPYKSRNILWMTPLPDHSNATPIVVGDRVFVASEPDELICIDKNTGKVLWNAMNGYYDATPQAERDANPAFAEKIDPLAKALKAEGDPVKRWALRKELQAALLEVDKEKYTIKASGHLGGHFEIVGFSTTPASDGKSVYVWNGMGVAACYDLDGNRKWIRRLPPGKELHYSAAPAVIAGKLAVFFEHLYGLDAASGEIAWEQRAVDKTVAAVLAARIAGADVFISQQGEVVRASDGHMLWANPHKITNDTGWAPPVVIGDVVYIPWYGSQMIWVEDFTDCAGDEWKPREDSVPLSNAGFPKLPKAPMGIPREQTAGSPLIHEGLVYEVDWCGAYIVVDLKAKKTLAYREIGLQGEANYVAMPVAASPTLVGRHIVVMDNQGNTVVLEPGAECKIVAHNRIANQIPRDWSMTTLGLTTYAPPVPAGTRMYIRGERHLYCIGGK
ncbi:MAG TPA: PQQ-binding-like beta-propeller repeat protein [Planctomycetota bacterium]|nr:PQQ-binding-like beta-propeller repeat protein [Planctomycetota bacterium]